MTEFDVAAVDLSGILNKPAEDKAKQLPDPKTFPPTLCSAGSYAGVC
jgi:hypothetical protein